MADQDVELYFFPGSYFSQKVRIALAEKKIKHKETLMSLMHYDHHQAWFLKINPEGQIPLLRIGDKYIFESDKIVEAVDQLESTEGRLIPDPSTELGKSIIDWMARLHALKTQILTYGFYLNPSLSNSGLKIPNMIMTYDVYREEIKSSIKSLEDTKAQNPDLAVCIDKLLERQKVREDASCFDPEILKGILSWLDGVIEDVDKQLASGKAGDNGEKWLCGTRFTGADINLCIMIGRLDLLGLGERYLDPEKRPAVVQYWAQAVKRPSINDMIVNALPQAKAYMATRKGK